MKDIESKMFKQLENVLLNYIKSRCLSDYPKGNSRIEASEYKYVTKLCSDSFITTPNGDFIITSVREPQIYVLQYYENKNNQSTISLNTDWWRIRDLTFKRVANINNTLLNIKTIKNDQSTFPEKVEKIRKLIEDAIMENISLSSAKEYSKLHISYKQNRTSGLNIFSSWWHKTWFQSRANAALEKCQDILGECSMRSSDVCKQSNNHYP